MKLFSGLLGTAVLAAALVGGCNDAHHYQGGALRPGIMIEGPREVSVGESQRLVAHTQDTAGAKAIQWTVEPNTAKLTAENATNGQSCMFSASQRGRYIVTARVDLGNNMAPVVSSTTVDVVGGATANDHMAEPMR